MDKIKKILKGAGLAGVGAGLAYLAGTLGQIDLGTWGPAAAAVLAVAANAVRQVLTPSEQPK
ncbi:MAG: hypothetical protein U0840_25675 [Gemmataceae bacterium]